MNDDNGNKLSIYNINNALSSSKKDEMTNDNKDNDDKNYNDSLILLGENNDLLEDIEAASVLQEILKDVASVQYRVAVVFTQEDKLVMLLISCMCHTMKLLSSGIQTDSVNIALSLRDRRRLTNALKIFLII